MTPSDPNYRILAETADRYRRVFERAPIALFEEDFSAVRRWINQRRAAGVTDIREHLESNPEAMWKAVGLIEIIDANPAAVELLGASSRENLLGTPAEPMVTERSLPWFLEEIVALAEGKESLRFDMSGQTFSGEERVFTVMWVIGPNGAGGDSHVVVAVVDITDQKRREEELSALPESKDSFIASVSHELRTPLTSIVGFARELQDGPVKFSNRERTEFVALIASQADELSDLIDDLLVFARLESDQLRVILQDVDLAEITRSVLKSHPTHGTQQVSASIESSTAIADPRRVRQIIRNLLSNAAKYGGELVRISTGFTRDTAVLLVRDNGPGLPPEHVEDAFDRYVSFGNARSTIDSIGLGLPISRQLAELMGGSLAYHRHDGWTEFRLVLPRAVNQGRGTHRGAGHR